MRRQLELFLDSCAWAFKAVRELKQRGMDINTTHELLGIGKDLFASIVPCPVEHRPRKNQVAQGQAVFAH